MHKQTLESQSRRRFVLAPKDFLISPFFAAKPQTGARQVTVGSRHYLIGGFHPMDDTLHPPALDVRHARAIFALLSFRADPLDKTQLIRFSFNQFCQQYASSNGGRYSRAIKLILRDLMNSFIRITDTKSQIAHEYRLIERIDIEKRPIRRKDARLAKSPQLEMWFNSCTLSPEFAGLLGDIDELQHLRFDVLNSMSSPLAQAIYLYIPSRAYYHDAAKPFEITLTNLLEQVSFPVPEINWIRKKLFTQNRNSILKQLDGAETLTGRFRVKLAPTAKGDDWKLLAWEERNGKMSAVREDSKIFAAWLRSGRTPDEFDRALTIIKPITFYELDLLEMANVVIEKNRPFFERAKALIGHQQFVSLLAEAKGDEKEGRKATKNPTARLIYRLMEEIATPPAAPLDSQVGGCSNVWTTK
jgi:hypothetical protein